MRKRNPLNDVSGMTLVELMIVMAVVVMLTGMATFSYTAARENTHRNLCISNLRMIDAVKEEYQMLNSIADGTECDPEDITPYFGPGGFPQCTGTSVPYTPGDYGTEDASCALSASKGHHR